MRLSDGPGRCAGRVEIQYEGVWKSVRASNWNDENSKVFCNQMICGDALADTDSFIQGTSQVLNNEVTCTSDSKSISNCIKSTNKRQQEQDKNKMLICQGICFFPFCTKKICILNFTVCYGKFVLIIGTLLPKYNYFLL